MRKFFIAAAVAVISLIASGSSAQAAFSTIQISLAEDGGSPVVVASASPGFTPISYTNTFGNFSVEVFGGSAHNAATLSDLLQSTTRVANNDTATHTLTLTVTQDNYTLPAGTLLKVESGLGGSVSAGTVTLTNIFQGYADAGNNLNGITDFTTGAQSASQNGSTFDTGSASGAFTRSGNYSLTSVVTFQLTGGGVANFSSHVNVTPTPAPAGLVLALTGMPVLGLGAWIRRKVKAQNS